MSEHASSSSRRDDEIAALIEREAGRLHALGVRFCGDATEAEDLVQETFLNAYRGFDTFEGRAKASTWLYSIAARVCQRMHRRRSGEPERIESLDELLPFGDTPMAVAPGEGDPLAESIRDESRRRIEGAIAALPLEFRMPLVLKEIAGLPLSEIARALGVNAATVKTRLHRARLKLRSALESALPRREVPPAAYSRQICLDLLTAKQEALDRGETFTFPDRIVCERCSELFATLDLSNDLCREIARDRLPDAVRRRLLEALAAER